MPLCKASCCRLLAIVVSGSMLVGCSYGKLLRPNTLKQLDPDVAELVDELQEVDHPNKAIVGRLLVHGGLTHATPGADGVMHADIRVPPGQFIWKPGVIAMPHGGRLQVDFSNDDVNHHMAFLPNDGGRKILDLPSRTRGRVEVTLAQPGLYWFGCPVSNHAGRGMLGLILVGGEVPQTAQLDRPAQQQPEQATPKLKPQAQLEH